jgi:hypothetical protein
MRYFVTLLLGVMLANSGQAAGGQSGLEKGFRNPPDSARPWILWFWLNGNMSSNGITADLEAMQRVGIRGVVIMDVDQGTPKGPVTFGSPQWFELFRHVCGEARRLGLEVNMNNDAGWSGSGGPWITPELSMQKVVWSETTVKGPSRFEGSLAQPETYKNFYRDIAVFAVPTSEGETIKMTEFSPKVSTSLTGPETDPAKLVDGDARTTLVFPRPEAGKEQFIQIEFAQPFSARRLVMTLPGLYTHNMCYGELQISNDGQTFKTIREFNAEASAFSLNFDQVTSKYFRILFTSAAWYLDHLTVAEVELSSRFRIDNIEEKASFVPKLEYPNATNPVEFPPSLAISRERITNLTALLHPDGRMMWEVPEGTWTILRFGHTSTGEDNKPSPEAGRGLECDKLSKAGAEAMFNGLVGEIITAVGPAAAKAFVATHIDSWEVSSQNWTPKFREEFQQRRAYDPLPFLTVLTGRVVDTLEVSERFLWDIRQTVSDLIVENYAGHFSELAHQHGMRVTVEAYDLNPCNDLSYAGHIDEPMAEFWSWPPYAVAYSCIEMASAAHVYGKKIVGVEAFTATDVEKWLGHPYAVKVFGDWAFCHGANRFVLHRYAHQPWTNPARVPGMSMGPWGLHYERTQTWWDDARPFHDYLARCQYLLQQGLFVADICYVTGEDAPQRWEVPGRSKERPGYNYDGCPPEIVLTRMSVKDGRIVLPDGMNYRLLVLPESKTMTPRLLAKIKQLVEAGATVLGPMPLKSPSLADFPNCDTQVRKLAEELWGDCDGKTVKEHRLGKGRVVWGRTPEEVLSSAGVPQDFAAQSTSSPQSIRYIHKSIGENEVFFVANKYFQPETAVCAFRVHNRRPELWWPDTGRIERPAVYDEADGTVRVPLRFDPCGSAFVIFRSGAELDPGRLTLLTQNGDTLLGTLIKTNTSESISTNRDMAGTFTMAAWVKPDIEIDLPEEVKVGITGLHVLRNDALYPPPGSDIFPGNRPAGSGVSVGNNGVCVFEHSDNYFSSTLVFAARLTNWTHIAVVYRENKPSLYLNGKFVHEGLKSDFAIHSGVGVKHQRGVGPFRGGVGEFKAFDRALTETELAELTKSMPVPVLPSDTPSVELTLDAKDKLKAQVWKAGAYVATTGRGRSVQFEVNDLPEPLKISGPWDLSFPPNQGAPARITLDELVSWSDRPEDGVKYFSGTATYSKTFRVPAGLRAKNQRLYLDLGKIAVMAEVRLNGKDLGKIWKPPFRMDVTEVLKSGDNALEVKVVNLWPNRMIGDEQLPEDSERKPNGTLKEWPKWLEENQPNPMGRYTFTTYRLWKKDSPLQQSGLLGPVSIIPVREVVIGRP